MKIRNGFVSNSSSSSFIVAFPKRPATILETHNMMFKYEQDIRYYDDVVSSLQIAEQVFKDIESNKEDSTQLKDTIAAELMERYHYYPPNHCVNVFWAGKVTDINGGAWSEPPHKYFGNNKEAMTELIKLIVIGERETKKYRDDLEKTMEKELKRLKVKTVPYAFEDGTNYEIKKKYTKKEISDYKKYSEKYEEIKDKSKEYIALQKEYWDFNRDNWAKESKLREQIAVSDTEVFIKDNPNSFIFIVQYSDNDGSFMSLMEHAGIFNGVNHIKISHH